MSSVNKVILVGNLGQDPDMKYTAAGKGVVTLRVATSYGKGEDAQTEWHRVTLWDNLAETAAKYLQKGDMVYLEGRLQTRSWEQDGVKRYATDIVGGMLQMLRTKGKDVSADAEKPATKTRKTVAKKSSALPDDAGEEW